MSLFLTVGTQLPFDRLVRAVDAWAGRQKTQDIEIFGQIGGLQRTSYRPSNFEWTEFLDPETFSRRFHKATHIVAHAGMGTIISSLMVNKPILVLPRLAVLSEQRNDHQIATVEKFADRPGVMAVLDEKDVADALTEMTQLPQTTGCGIGDLADQSLTQAIREQIMA
ncbi:MAG: glycosyltransferase [Pseudomonadota bacterium]